MISLSVNINKFATLRNARGGKNPNIIQIAKECEHFGAKGITIHPRPDERHIKYDDVIKLKEVIVGEFNIEGNPRKKYIDLVLETKPTQATLVPDEDNVLTSNQGWDIFAHKNYLKDIVKEFKTYNIRTFHFYRSISSSG